MLVNLQTIIGMAEAGGFCIPAFNVYNTETVMGVIDAAEAKRAPVILQVYPRLINEAVGFYIAPAVIAAAHRASVPVCLHLDHGPSMQEVGRALRYGFSGIMLDGSAHPLAENIALTRAAVEACANVGIGVEGEIGHVGSVNDAAMDEFTSPDEAAEFVKATGVCCLAVLIGNAHGHYKKPPKLDIERVKAIRAACGIPLVLHGGSGIPDEEVKAAIAAGADTYVSGRLSYNTMEEASEMGINLIEAGHYFTEAPVTNFFADLVGSIDGNAYIEILDSNMIKTF